MLLRKSISQNDPPLRLRCLPPFNDAKNNNLKLPANKALGHKESVVWTQQTTLAASAFRQVFPFQGKCSLFMHVSVRIKLLPPAALLAAGALPPMLAETAAAAFLASGAPLTVLTYAAAAALLARAALTPVLAGATLDGEPKQKNTSANKKTGFSRFFLFFILTSWGFPRCDCWLSPRLERERRAACGQRA